MPRAERLAVASDMLDADRRPCPLEMSALYIGDLEPWRHPTLCQFHYSDYWAETYRQLLDGRMRGCFLLDEDFPDPDIACHVRLTSESGICILGRPAEEVFPPVPEMDFWDSISRGIEETGPCVSSPRQIVADILNLVRVWSYGSEKRILSKYDAGCRAISRLPKRFRPIVEAALRAQYAGTTLPAYTPEMLEALRRHLLGRIRDSAPV